MLLESVFKQVINTCLFICKLSARGIQAIVDKYEEYKEKEDNI